MKVFALAGMPGAGKSTLIEKAVERGAYYIRMGDLVIEEVDRRGLGIKDGNVGAVAEEMRREHRAKLYGRKIPLEMFTSEMRKKMTREGLGYWAERTAERIWEECRKNVVFIDGVRGDMEVRVFKRRFNDFTVIAIHSSREDRYERIAERSREDDISQYEELIVRDNRELAWGLGKVIAMADVMLVNDGTLEEFREKAEVFLDVVFEE